MLTVRRGKMLHLPRRHCDQNTLNPAKHQRILCSDRYNRLHTTVLHIERTKAAYDFRGQKKERQDGALSPTENTDQLALVLERLEDAIAAVFGIVDGQGAVGIGSKRPGVEALQRLVAQREGRAIEGPRSAAHELVSYRILAIRRDSIVVGLDKRPVALQHQGSIGNDECRRLGLGNWISGLNRECACIDLAGVDRADVPDASSNGLKIPLSVHAANSNGVAAVSVSSSLDFLVSILPRALLVKEGR
jgi:hypothetical protein